MLNTFRFNKKYALIFIGLLIVELMIALYVKTPFIRGTIGDVLVVMLLYCFVMALFDIKKLWAIIGVWIFAIAVEISQAFKLIEILNLQDYVLANWVLGATYDFNDIIAYTVGCILLYVLEYSKFGVNSNHE